MRMHNFGWYNAKVYTHTHTYTRTYKLYIYVFAYIYPHISVLANIQGRNLLRVATHHIRVQILLPGTKMKKFNSSSLLFFFLS